MECKAFHITNIYANGYALQKSFRVMELKCRDTNKLILEPHLFSFGPIWQ